MPERPRPGFYTRRMVDDEDGDPRRNERRPGSHPISRMRIDCSVMVIQQIAAYRPALERPDRRKKISPFLASSTLIQSAATAGSLNLEERTDSLRLLELIDAGHRPRSGKMAVVPASSLARRLGQKEFREWPSPRIGHLRQILSAIISSSRALGRMRTPSSSPPLISARMKRPMSSPVAESAPAGAAAMVSKNANGGLSDRR